MYDFLYYTYYCLVLKGKKYGSGEERASFMLSVVVSFYIIAVYFFVTIQFRLNIINPKVVAISMALLLFGMMHFHRVYFVKTGRYIQIKEKYNNTSKRAKFIYGIFALIMFLVSPVAFFVTAIFLGQYANPH